MTRESLFYDLEKVAQLGLTEDEGKALWNWYRLREFGGNAYKQKAAHVGAICLKHRLSRAAISSLIGPYSHSGPSWIFFNIAPSQTMYFLFDEDDIVKSVKINGQTVSLGGIVE